MANGWSPERRQRQAQAIRTWRPWEHSTGPRTKAGKGVTSRNAWKGGERPAMRLLTAILRGIES